MIRGKPVAAAAEVAGTFSGGIMGMMDLFLALTEVRN
jgi:hypothetical protein